jgi:sulfite oxidase
MDELRSRFPTRTITAVLQCAGNRRADLHAIRPVTGDPWAPGAIGNAEWTGVPLADVLRAAGVDETACLHVAFAAFDECRADGRTFRYGVSIPLPKALHPDTLLAFAMNGAPLTPVHGHPLRALVPGYAGVRSPKWLASIEVQEEPSDNPMQALDYKLFPPDVASHTADWTAGVTINEMPVNAAICEPAAGTRLAPGPCTARGWATATGRPITRVDVSPDGGRSWRQARLECRPDQPWSWTLWEATLDLPAGEHELAVRAWDGAGQTQPARAEEVWNFKGYLCAAWHRVRVSVG